MKRVRNKDIATVATALTESRYTRIALDTASKPVKTETVEEYLARGGRIKKIPPAHKK